MSHFQRFLKKISKDTRPEALEETMLGVASDLGIQSFAYLEVNTTNSGSDDLLLLGNYGADWADHYFGNRYQHVDPVILNAPQATQPYHWGPDGDIAPTNDAQDRLFKEAGQHGITHGWTIPVHDTIGRVATLNFSGSGDLTSFRENIEGNLLVLHVTSIYFHTYVRKHRASLIANPPAELSVREIECIHWAARGKSRTDIASILNIRPRTIKFHLENAMKKLGVATTRQAAIKAVMLGLIAP